MGVPIRDLAAECASQFCDALCNDGYSSEVGVDEDELDCVRHFLEQEWFVALPAQLAVIALQAARRVMQARFRSAADNRSQRQSDADE